MNKVYSIIQIQAPYTYKDNMFMCYVAVPCVVINKTINEQGQPLYNVAVNINSENKQTAFTSNNGDYLNIRQTNKVFESISESKKEVEVLNDVLVRQTLKNCSLFDAREIAKVLRQNLNFAENLQTTLLCNNENVR